MNPLPAPARPRTGTKLARPLVIAGTVAAATAAYGNRDKHAAAPLAVAAAVNAAAMALTLLLIKPVEKEIEVGLACLGLMCSVRKAGHRLCVVAGMHLETVWRAARGCFCLLVGIGASRPVFLNAAHTLFVPG